MTAFDPFIWYSIAILLNIVFSWVVIFKPTVLSKNTTLSRKADRRFFWFFIIFLSGIMILSGIPLVETTDSPRFWLVLLGLELLFFSAVTDIYYRVIPNRVLAIFIIVWVLVVLITGELDSIANLIPAGIVMLVVFSINQLSRLIVKNEAFGYGDLKLLGVLSLFFNWDIFWIFYLAIIVGAVTGSLLIMAKKRSRSSKVSFAPMLFLGALLNTAGAQFNVVYNYLQVIL